jgi:Putative zinc-finger
VPDHPDREQLAAFQAGDGDRRQRAEIETHLAGCPSCAQVVASVEQARRRLAVLEEPALPPGLHDRLAAAVEAEAAQPAPATGPAPWYRRPVAWGAAAALLLAALIVPLLDRSSGDLTTAGGGAGDASQEAATAGGAAGSLPVIWIPGEVSAATVRSRLATDRRAKDALDSAASTPGASTPGASTPGASAPGAGAPGAGSPGSGVPGAQAATPSASQGAGPDTQSPDQAGGYRSSASAPPAGTAHLQPCLPAATADAAPATRPLRPAFFIQGSYRGREATILVTTSIGQPGRVDLWVFPRDTCSSRPLDTEQVR